MRVVDLMKKQVFTVGPDDLVDRVFFLLHYEKIRHLPVVERGQVIGIVSDRDLYKALGPRGQHGEVETDEEESSLRVISRKVRHIMKRGVITIEPDAFIGKAAAMMATKKIGALPVVKGKKLVGIVTSTDLLAALARMPESYKDGEKA